MQSVKLLWAIRAEFYKLSFRHIGKRTYIGKPVYLSGEKKISLGNKVRIFPGARMEVIGNGSITVKDDVSIGQNLHIISENEDLTIDSGTLISSNVFITNTDHTYEKIGVPVVQQPRIVRTTRIGKECFIGYGVAIEAGTILGNHCIVGTNAVVRGVFPDNSVIVGIPAKVIKRYDGHSDKWMREMK